MALISCDDLGNITIKTVINKHHSSVSNHMSIKTSKTNLYIKGLPGHFNDDLLEQLVPSSDKVKSVKAAIDEGLKCKGYGFIDFLNEEYAEEAKKFIETNYSTFPVKFAKENEKDKTNLYVTNIPKEWSSADSDKLKIIFEKFGEVQSAFIMQEKTTSKTTGVGFVRFSNERDAERAIELLQKNKMVLSQYSFPLEVKYADKHNSETRKRRSIDGHLKSYPFNLVAQRPSLFGDLDVHGCSTNIMLGTAKQQDLLSLYPTLFPPGHSFAGSYQNQIPYQSLNAYNQLSNLTGQWNIPFLTNDFFSPPISTISNTDYICAINQLSMAANNTSNQNYLYNNHHIAE